MNFNSSQRRILDEIGKLDPKNPRDVSRYHELKYLLQLESMLPVAPRRPLFDPNSLPVAPKGPLKPRTKKQFGKRKSKKKSKRKSKKKYAYK